MEKPTWGIVSTINEPLAVTLTFVAHHLSAGAQEMHIYLDQDDPETVAALSTMERVRVEVCDADYWRREFDVKPPKTHQRRQSRNATRSYGKSDVDYLLHLDADEYLWQFSPLNQELAGLEEGRYLSIPNIERIYPDTVIGDGMYSTYFRRSSRAVGGGAKLFSSDRAGLTRFGLTGHSAGKSATPRGSGYEIGIHRPHYPGPRPWAFPKHRRSSSSVILHFEGLTPLGWVYKRLRKAHFLRQLATHPVGDQMRAQIAAIGDGGIPAGLALHSELQGLDPRARKHLERLNLLVQAEFQPEVALERWFPGARLDLSVAGFDHWLMQQKGQFLNFAG